MIAGAGAEDRRLVAAAINAAWAELRERVVAEFAKSRGRPRPRSRCAIACAMQYVGQLNDVEIDLPVRPGADRRGTSQEIVERFEDLYSKMYSRSARSPELGYLVTQRDRHGGRAR